jgi:hypothetical protein
MNPGPGAVVLMLAVVAEVHAQDLPTPNCVNPEMAGHVRTTVLDGIDQAMRNRVAALFEGWMRDQTEQPKRAIEGMNLAIGAYIRARNNALKWNPPVCALSGTGPRYDPPK